MATSEILDTSLRLYQRLGLTFLRLTVVPTLLCVAALAFVQEYALPQFFFTKAGNQFSDYALQIIVTVLLGIFVAGPLFLAGLSYTTALVVTLVSDDLVGNASNPDLAVQNARKAMPRLLVSAFRELIVGMWGVLIATGVLIGGMAIAQQTDRDSSVGGWVALVGVLGIMFGGLLWVYVIARDAIVPPIVVLEGLKATPAARRSNELMKKFGMHPAGTSTGWVTYLLAFFIYVVFLLSLAIIFGSFEIPNQLEKATTGWPLQALILQIFELVPGFLGIWFVLPIWASTITVLYIDRRIRLEGFDVEVLARDLARKPAAGRYEL